MQTLRGFGRLGLGMGFGRGFFGMLSKGGAILEFYQNGKRYILYADPDGHVRVYVYIPALGSWVTVGIVDKELASKVMKLASKIAESAEAALAQELAKELKEAEATVKQVENEMKNEIINEVKEALQAIENAMP